VRGRGVRSLERRAPASIVAGALALVAVARAAPPTDHAAGGVRCPEEMALVGAACVDRWEAHLVRLDASGAPTGAHPANEPVGGRRVRAVSSRGAVPQGHVSRDEAAAACAEADKRLCTSAEWLAACRGPSATRYPYGTRRRAGACNDRGVEPLARVLGRPASEETWGFAAMNDPRLLLVPGAVARTGRFDRCRSEHGTYDMVGNLHEWTAEESGVMRGGYFLDTDGLGEGCDYVAVGHDAAYRDYSTGFRCCADPR
jgi:formylglycine-generating enzyme required for sulfatase activity